MGEATLSITRPRLISYYFPGDAPDQFSRLARVLRFTAAAHCPEWAIEVQQIEPEPCRAADGTAAYEHNTQKLDAWAAAVGAAADGERILLIDADTMIARPLDDVWADSFDLAYTVRPLRTRLPLNAGVIFLRVSDRTRAFLARWRDENRRMLRDRLHHQAWRTRYGGINQAALGAVLESEAVRGVSLLQLPCVEWNCEDSTWADFDPNRTRIVHLKSSLRMAVFHGHSSAGLKPIITAWRRQEQAAIRAWATA